MSDLRIALTPPETLDRFRAVVENLLEGEEHLTTFLRDYVHREAAALGVHPSQVMTMIETVLRECAVNLVDGAEMVWVPPGSFAMGDDFPLANPPQPVRLTRGFWLYRMPVTNAQYRLFVQATRHREPSYWDDELFSAPAQPVVGVSWSDAQAYAEWAGGRLPAEAEWEYAARGPENRKYPWGDQEPDDSRAVYEQDGWGGPKAAGGLPGGASWCGALDLAGNVWEWCEDWFGHYRIANQANPAGRAGGTERVIRGGCYEDHRMALHAAFRDYSPPRATGITAQVSDWCDCHSGSRESPPTECGKHGLRICERHRPCLRRNAGLRLGFGSAYQRSVNL